jgi:hypothetical protein
MQGILTDARCSAVRARLSFYGSNGAPGEISTADLLVRSFIARRAVLLGVFDDCKPLIINNRARGMSAANRRPSTTERKEALYDIEHLMIRHARYDWLLQIYRSNFDVGLSREFFTWPTEPRAPRTVRPVPDTVFVVLLTA